MSTVIWPPLVVERNGVTLTVRVATLADVPTLERWDQEPDVIACATDNPTAKQAFTGAAWSQEIAANNDASCYYLAELDGRPIGAMQVIDPQLEPTHYWGGIEPNLRAIDIWIGSASDRGHGHGTLMMSALIDACFADPAVTGIVIDPLHSNLRAHRFYQRLGFIPAGRQLFNGEDDCLVHRLARADWRSRLESR
jgi:aminoglycoside 6'-N-acetyltransferase